MKKMSTIMIYLLCKIGSNVPKNQESWIYIKALKLKEVEESLLSIEFTSNRFKKRIINLLLR